MKRISAVKLLVVLLALIMSAPSVYAIKHTKKVKPRKLGIKVSPKGSRQQPKARQPITPKKQGTTHSSSKPVSQPALEQKLASAEMSNQPEASRPLQHASLATLKRGFMYSFPKPTYTRISKEAQTEMLKMAQDEILIRAQEFVTQRGRWMQGELTGSRAYAPWLSDAAWDRITVKGVTQEEVELSHLATEIMLYGDGKYPAVTQLIELYESFLPADKKGLVESMREVIEFSQREDRLLKEGTHNPELDTEGRELLRKLADRIENLHYTGANLILKQGSKMIEEMQERNSQRYFLNRLENFVAKEGRLPQSYGWNGKEQTMAQYTRAQQEEYSLLATAKMKMRQYPAGENTFVDRIRQLWEQYGQEQ